MAKRSNGKKKIGLVLAICAAISCGAIIGGWLYTQSNTRTIPAGFIGLWSGPLSTIPAGWQLCDGSNGTPDMRDRIVMFVDDGEDPGITGGNLTHYHNYSMIPRHDHGGYVTGLMSHRHYTDPVCVKDAGTTFGIRLSQWNTTRIGGTFSTADPWIHRLNDAGVAHPETEAASSLPPYTRLAFIQSTQSVSTLPVGLILAWIGPVAAIPAGWIVCNGASGTPDLAGKYVMGASSGEDPGYTNASVHEHVYTEVPLHGNQHGIGQMPTHEHNWYYGDTPQNDSGLWAANQGGGPINDCPSMFFENPSDFPAAESPKTALEGLPSCRTSGPNQLPAYTEVALVMLSASGPTSVPGDVAGFWGQSLSSIPDGWNVCNGTAGTADTSNTFPRGYTTAPGARGGSLNHDHPYSELPQHQHGIYNYDMNWGYSVFTVNNYNMTGSGLGWYLGFGMPVSAVGIPITNELGPFNHSIGYYGDTNCVTNSSTTLPPYCKLACITNASGAIATSGMQTVPVPLAGIGLVAVVPRITRIAHSKKNGV